MKRYAVWGDGEGQASTGSPLVGHCESNLPLITARLDVRPRSLEL